MGWRNIQISKEQDYLVIYSETGGKWTTSNHVKKFVPSSEIYETKTIVVRANDYTKARAIAHDILEKGRAINTCIKIYKAVPIPEKNVKIKEVI